MPTAVIMPKMGMTMEEGTVIQWFKQEGEQVKKGEPLLEIMTDKVNMEVEAPASGILQGVVAGANDTVPATQTIAYIVEAGESVPAPSAPPVTQPAAVAQPAAGAAAGTAERDVVPASPLARRLAREAGLDLASIHGTGPGGRVVEADVKAAIAAAAKGAAAPPRVEAIAAPSPAPAPAAVPGPAAAGRLTPLTGKRKIIAQRMALSAHVPQFALGVNADMSRVEEARGAASPTAMLVRVAAHALAHHPMLNASFAEDSVRLHDQINIGVAVNAEDGLVVPVVKNAGGKSLPALDAEIKDLAERARSGKLAIDDVTGGTFTISNLGMFGIEEFQALVNPPEAAILAVGRIAPQAVIAEGTVVARPMLHLVLSADHRVVDGATAAAFLMEVKRLLENPYELL
jgi:pyruvate dehydrogenase E2 component (dihydrolipoamide acetyltransferase)